MKASNSHGGECLCPVLQALSGTATASSIMPDLKMCLTFLLGCAVITVLTGVMSYAGLAVQMRHARRLLSRAWQQNMHWTCAKQLSALRYSFLVLLNVTPDSTSARIVNMETLFTWTQYNEHPLLQQARHMLDYKKSFTHLTFTFLLVHRSFCFSFFPHAGQY